MASSSDVDPHQVLAALGIDGVEAVEPLNGGVDTLMWRVEAGGRYALRVFSSEQQDIATKEGQLMPLLGSLGYPGARRACGGALGAPAGPADRLGRRPTPSPLR